MNYTFNSGHDPYHTTLIKEIILPFLTVPIAFTLLFINSAHSLHLIITREREPLVKV